MRRRIVAAAVAVVCVLLVLLLVLQGRGGSDYERRPVPEVKRNAPGDFQGSGFQGGEPPEAPETPPAD
ncbi:MAG: hypothetical protein ACYTEI_07480 [Planctomycetota bacterium]|jgi:hypothetical protein